jgi:HD-GYP domain-containing protein (c-di-GMP phosphodiesterase class II)
MLKYAVGRGFRTQALVHSRLRVGESHAGRVALERCFLSISDLRQEPGDFHRAPLLEKEAFVCYFAMPLIAKGQVKGVVELFHRTQITPDQEWHDFFSLIASTAAIAIDNLALFDHLQRSNAALALAYDATLEGWSRALDMRDKETEGHTQRVTEITERLASLLEFDDSALIHVRRGALLHDIGKMGIPDAILLKPDRLTEDEWAIMRKHPEYAYTMLSRIAYLRPALDIPYCHHERWDGSGYPRGLKGEQIPLAARIFSVVDVWDALTSNRPYRAAWSEEEAIRYIQSQAGNQFDPKVVEVFLKIFNL